MNLLRKLFGKKPQPVQKSEAPVPAPVVKEKPVITLDIVEQTHDEPSLVDLAISGETTQLRQAAASKIAGREALEQLLKQLKNKDKNVLKLVKAKLDVFKEVDNQQVKRDEQGKTLCEKCERLSHHEADTVFKAKLQLIEQEFSTLTEGLSEDIRTRFAKAKQLCENKLRAQADIIAQEEERLAQDHDALKLAEDSLASLETIAKGLVNEAQLSEEALRVCHIRLDELNQALRLAKQRDINLNHILPVFENRKTQVLNYLDFVKQNGTLLQVSEQFDSNPKSLSLFNKARKLFPADIIETSTAVTDALAKHAKIHSDAQAVEAAKQDQAKAIAELIRKGQWAANNGHMRKARGISRELNELRATLLAPLSTGLETKWTEFEAQLEKLGDWHEFAVTPKKQQLILDMQALSESTLAPDALATRIHELQDEWKEVSRGGQQQDDELWQNFQAASAVAYAPCKDFFEAQARLRDENLKHRESLVATLKEYLSNFDWNLANWKNVEQTLKVARQEWQTFWPVPRKAGNELATQFETLMDELHGKIKAEFDKNKQAKQAVVAQAAEALTLDDIRSAIDTIKALQATWKTLGKTWHREDQALWTQFREHCDAVFARRQAQASEAKETELANATAGESIIAELNALAGNLDLATREKLDELQTAFRALPLNKKDASRLELARKSALEAIDAARKTASTQRKQAARAELRSLVERLHAAELSGLNGSVDEELRNQLIEASSAQEHISNSIKNILIARANNIGALPANQQNSSEQQLRLLAIRAEILRGTESPMEDKAARMNYQVEQMQQGLGQSQLPFEELEKLWWATPAVSSTVYDSLERRFFGE